MDLPIDQAAPNTHSTAAAAAKGDKCDKTPFPWTLHRLLDESEENQTTHIVSWLSSGKAFKVHQRDTFMSEILPAYFRQTRYKSFVRQLNLWGFSCTSRGVDKGSYSHKAFVRGQPARCSEMKRAKIKGSSNVAATTGAASSSASSPVAASFDSPRFQGVSASRFTRAVSTSSRHQRHDGVTSRIQSNLPLPVFSCPEPGRFDAVDMDWPSPAPSCPVQDSSHRRHWRAVSIDVSDAKITNEISECVDKVSRKNPGRSSVNSVSLGGLLDLAPQFDDWLESTFGASSKADTESSDSGRESQSESFHSDQLLFGELPMVPFNQQNGSYHFEFDNIADLDFDLGFK